MIKKKLLIGLSCFGIIIIIFVSESFLLLNEKKMGKMVIGEKEYSLEIANTSIKRVKGLGERDSLCRDCGMLFVFDAPGQRAFWMKDMRFSIDIIWLLGDEVVFVEHSVSPESQEILKPEVSADGVLEINVGEGKNLSVGDKVHFISR